MKNFIQNHHYATFGSIIILLEEIEDKMILDEDFEIELKVLKKLIKLSSTKTLKILEEVLKNHNMNILKNINHFDERFENEIIEFIFDNSFKNLKFIKQSKLVFIDSKLEYNNLQAYFHEDVKRLILKTV